jgi:predicted nucleic acid-binding protein
MDITHMDTTRTAITDRIRTMATTMGLHTTGTAGIVITATTVIITTVIIGKS